MAASTSRGAARGPRHALAVLGLAALGVGLSAGSVCAVSADAASSDTPSTDTPSSDSASTDSASTDSASIDTAPQREGFAQLLPRGAIPALVDPVFVDAAAAKIPDDAWVLGFARDGESFAYDLNLLNGYEVVNHGSERSRIAAVW